MAYRYSNTDKWGDCWFSKLKPIEKLLFNYLCDNCDIAGFIELNTKRWASDIVTEVRTIEGALKGLGRGLIYSDTNDCIFIRNYLKHQKNLPLDPVKNPAHKGIIKRFELYSFKFNIININEFIEGACKGLQRPLGNGNVLGNGNGKKSINVPFEKFWNIYDKKEDRVKCEVKWKNLTDEERILCIDNLPAYIQSTPDKKYRKNPATFLNNKSWENEIIKNKALVEFGLVESIPMGPDIYLKK